MTLDPDPTASPATPPSRLDRLAPLLVILIALGAAAFTLFIVTPGYIIDDAYIGFRYARNLVEGHGLVFNPGVPCEGYTSFLWVLIAACGIKLGIEPIHFVQGVSVFAQLVTIGLVYQIGRQAGHRPSRALIAPLFLAAHITFLTYPMTGMDASFIAMLVTLCIWLLHATKVGLGRAALLGLALCLVVLTRFDGFVMLVILAGFMICDSGWAMVRKQPAGGKILALVVVLLITGTCLAVYNMWRIDFYPTPLPNTFYAKMVSSLSRLAKGVVYLARFFLDDGNHYMLVLGALPFAVGKLRRGTTLLGWVVTAHLVYTILVGGDWMPNGRFILPILPALILLMQDGIWEAARLGRENLRASAWNRLFAVVALVMLFGFDSTNLYRKMFGGYQPDLKNLTQQWVRQGRFGVFDAREYDIIGRNIDRMVPEDWSIAAEWAGVLPYYSHHVVHDMLGLNDPEATQQEPRFPTSTIGIFITPEFVKKHWDPDMVVVLARLLPTPEEAIAAANERIHPTADNFGARWVRNTYGVLEKPAYGYKMVTLKIADSLPTEDGKGLRDGYWPVLVKSRYPDPPWDVDKSYGATEKPVKKAGDGGKAPLGNGRKNPPGNGGGGDK